MFKLVLVVILLFIAGCAPVTAVILSTPTPAVSSTPTLPAARATPIPSQQEPTKLPVPTESATPLPGLNVVPRNSWSTFTSAKWQVVVDYPPDWSVQEGTAGVVFSSSQGVTIFLAPVETGGLSPDQFLSERQLPNTRCSSSTNAYGVTARVCFDTIAFSYDASIVLKSSSGGARLLSLSTRARPPGDVQVFNVMVASMRSLP
jgi:hypothetical protein